MGSRLTLSIACSVNDLVAEIESRNIVQMLANLTWPGMPAHPKGMSPHHDSLSHRVDSKHKRQRRNALQDTEAVREKILPIEDAILRPPPLELEGSLWKLLLLGKAPSAPMQRQTRSGASAL